MNWKLFCLPLIALAVACGDDDGDDSGTDTDTDIVGDPASGQTLFTQNCVSCHPADGSAGTGSAMSEVVPDLSDEQIDSTIQNGVAGTTMTAFPNLDAQDRADIIAWLNQEFDA